MLTCAVSAIARPSRAPGALARCLALAALLWGVAVSATAAEAVRVGVLEFGTVQWTLDVVQHHGLARERGVDLQVLPLGSKNAVSVALQGGAVDLIVSDWIWVSRQRAAGRPYTFVPYSVATGAVVVRPDAGIEELADLQGRRLGVAGGPVDKSWLLLQAYAHRTLGKDFAASLEPTFAAPPLLNQLLLRRELPAVLNYWHYSARLEAAGMRRLISVEEVVRGLGIEGPIPVLGWVFDERWGGANAQALAGFLAAVAEASERLAHDDAEWERIRDLVKPENAAALVALRDAYRAGIAAQDTAHVDAARRVFHILAEEGGAELVGASDELAPGTFWVEHRRIGRR